MEGEGGGEIIWGEGREEIILKGRERREEESHVEGEEREEINLKGRERGDHLEGEEGGEIILKGREERRPF